MIFATQYNFKYSNLPTSPSTTLGTLITPGYSAAEGSWTQVATAANISQNVYWIYIQWLAQGGNGQPASLTFDVGIDTTGGTSYTPIISNALAGGSGSISNKGKVFWFPYYIPAGSSVAIRASTNATANACRVMFEAWGQPGTISGPVGTTAETIGHTGGPNGTGFTLGTSPTYGSWASLGTTTQANWWWQLGINVENSNITGTGITLLELAWGDVSTKTLITRSMITTGTSETSFDLMSGNVFQPYYPLPAGTELWIRGYSQNAPDSGHTATVIGIGS